MRRQNSTPCSHVEGLLRFMLRIHQRAGVL
jgi:hypothetical protein